MGHGGKGRDGTPLGPASAIDSYCADCVECCKLCTEDIHPKRQDKYSIPLDDAVKRSIDAVDFSIDCLGEDAKAGETIHLCKKCFREWERHPDKGKPFPGFTKEEREQAGL